MRIRRNGYLGVKNLTLPFAPPAPTTSISYKTGFFHYRMTFAAYIRCFCAQFTFDLVNMTTTFWPWWCPMN